MNNQKVMTAVLALVLVISLVSLVLLFRSSGRVKALESKVTALRTEFDTARKFIPPYVYAGEPAGYILQFENGLKFYFAADSGLTGEFKVIGDFYKPEVAFIPVGNIYTMDYRAGAYAASLVNPSRFIVPNHYASYPMLEPDASRFAAEAARYSPRAKVLNFVEGTEQDILGVKVLWLGHGTWRFVSPKGVEIFIDPQFTYNPKFPHAWKDMKNFSRTRLVLLSHGHFDHTAISDIQLLLKDSKPFVIAPFELGIWLKQYLSAPVVSCNKGSLLGKAEAAAMGVPAEIAEGMGDVKVVLTPASHSSGATPAGETARY